MSEPRWLSKAVVLAIHSRLLEEHGGAAGIRDEGLLDSALAGPKNQYHYGQRDILELGATYAYGITRNHPFVDGNKRVAFAAAGVFIECNGYTLIAPEEDAVNAMLALTTSRLDREGFTTWLQGASERSTADE